MPRRLIARAIALGTVILTLAGCAAYSLVPAGRATARNAISIESPLAWSKVPLINEGSAVELWTLNGPAIDSMAFYAPIGDNQSLQNAKSGTDPFPVFRAGMTPSEIAELFETTLRRATGSAIVEVKSLRPAKLGDSEGFRAETEFTGSDRVRRKGILTGAVKDKKLYLIHFQAPELHYYAKAVPEVEKMLASAKLL